MDDFAPGVLFDTYLRVYNSSNRVHLGKLSLDEIRIMEDEFKYKKVEVCNDGESPQLYVFLCSQWSVKSESLTFEIIVEPS